ncbi:MAG: iron ABC transporter permease [Deltaproteobacteria bacterium]|nr:iron ABC transporter permease [Deltaproteobacteria bacterium]
MRGRLARVPWSWLLIGGLTAGALIAFAFAPLALVLKEAGRGRFQWLFHELSEPGTRVAFLNTLAMSALVTAVAVPAGAALAWLLERTDVFATERVRTRFSALFAVPLAVPPYLLAMAWALLGNGRNGLLNRLGAGAWIDLYGLDGTVLVLATSAYPFVMLTAQANLRRADPSLEEAARVSGAGPWGVLKTVTLPLMLPALAASAGLVFVFATAAFGVPYLLGSVAEPPVYVLTTRIFQYISLGGADMLSRASALALVLLSTSLAAQSFASWIARRRSTVQVGGKAARPALLRLGRVRPFAQAGLLVGAALFILLPLGTIVWTSVARSFADPFDPTLAHWREVLAREETARAFAHSVLLALGAGALVAVLGLVVARLSKQFGRPGAVLAAMAASPYAVPGTVLAIGLLLAFAYEYRLIVLDTVTFALYLPGTLGLLLVAYAVKYMAFGVRGARAALDQIHPSLEEAARTSGAGPLKSAVDVVLPLVSPAVGAAFLIVALPCLSELTMSVLLFGAGTETAGTLLFELQSYADPPAAAVVATMVVAVAVAGDSLARRLQRRAEGRMPPG